MTLQAGDKLMLLADVSEMLAIPVHNLYRLRYKGDGPVGYRVGRHVRYRRESGRRTPQRGSRSYKRPLRAFVPAALPRKVRFCCLYEPAL